MLNSEDFNRIYQQAYLPEHLPDYVESISGAQTHLLGNYLCFVRKKHLIFNGYPLAEAGGDAAQVYLEACRHFKPTTVAVLAPELWLPEGTYEKLSSDHYYRLSLPLTAMDPRIAYMVRRGERELSVRCGPFQKEHKRLVKNFVKTHNLSEAQTRIYSRIHHYLKRCRRARILEARKGALLVAFSVVDLGAADYAFYLFNFRSEKYYVPGASDLLFREMTALAQCEHKKAINLGLGVHAGVRRFKEKWGAEPFLTYRSALVHRGPENLGNLAAKL